MEQKVLQAKDVETLNADIAAAVADGWRATSVAASATTTRCGTFRTAYALVERA